MLFRSNSAGYGNVSVELIVDPEFEIVQADNISDYGPQLNIDPASLEPLESTKLKQIEEVLKQSERFFINNEYNYYDKDFEETKIKEENLLNINKNYSSIDIRQYFADRNYSLLESKTMLHPVAYVKELYPKFDKQKYLFPMFMEIKFETDIVKTELVSFLEKINMLDYFCYYYIFKLTDKKINFIKLKNIIKSSIITDTDLQISENYNGNISNIKTYKKNS